MEPFSPSAATREGRVFPEYDADGYVHKEEEGFSLFSQERCKRVFFIRHAEGWHNLAEHESTYTPKVDVLLEKNTGRKYWDAALTPKGEQQCGALKANIRGSTTWGFDKPLNLDLVVVSPLMRTLQTAELSLGEATSKNAPKFLAQPLCRERIADYVCDGRCELSVLKRQFPGVDFSLVETEKDDDFYNQKEDIERVRARAVVFLQWLCSRPERRIAVVTHSIFLRNLFYQFGTSLSEADQMAIKTFPANAEMRSIMLCAHQSFERAGSLKMIDAKDAGDRKLRATCDIGIIGLATMGSNLALNIADKGYEVAVFNRTYTVTETFMNTHSAYRNLHGTQTIEAFVDALKKPRRALILVKAGAPTDATIQQLTKHFDAGDIIVDTGNAHFRDQARRAKELEAKGLRFLGMGISGGEEGARKGPAFFPGGTLSVWEDIKDVIQAASAKADDGRPCAVMNGKGGAGSCVKMYHNAGEYAILQIWGEVYTILRQWRVPATAQAELLTSWKTKIGGKHKNFLASYMLDITTEVVRTPDNEGAGGKADGSLLIERTMDIVGSKGTGLWSVQEALGAGVPAPSLAQAVLARQMSMYRSERHANAKAIALPAPQTQTYQGEDLEDLFWATGLAIIASYAQMFQCLRVLDKECGFGLHLPSTIATFRAGCILQGYLLGPMTKAFETDPNLPNLLCAFSAEIKENMPRLRRVMAKVLREGNAATPVMLASMTYIETMLSDILPAGQTVALQRDVFGRHGFKRLDRDGDFSATWPELQ